jgi:threonylcarbamoyladenosine tRNA methylthiotransferase MtaB
MTNGNPDEAGCMTHDEATPPRSLAVVTFGCRVNQADSLAIERDWLARGAALTSPDRADLVVVNTCSVTATADQGARQTIRRVARENPGARIVVTGCYATRQPSDLAGLPNILRIVPNTSKDDLFTALETDVRLPTTAERYDDGEDGCGAVYGPGLAGRTALTLRVQTGCEEQCSYCIIPRTRGASRSRPLSQVLREVRLAVEAGYKEVAITGVHLGSYGRDLDDGTSLVTLVRALADWREDVLFRISSLEPMDCTPEIVACVAGSPRLAPHFHLPLQHGADQVLKAMCRPYTAAEYESLVHGIRERMPHASIGSDVIVGFPGESDAHFESMRTLLRRLPLTHLHVFPYSDRPGTAASDMTGKIDAAVVRTRGREVRDIGAAMTRAFRASQAGRLTRALTVDDGWSAVTPNYLKIRLDRQRERNEWVAVRIASTEPLRGELLDE